MIYATPGDTFTALLSNAPTGLVGTLTAGIENVDGTTEVAQATTGIVEVESTAYVATRTAPTDSGSYVFLWKNGATVVAEELVVGLGHPVITVDTSEREQVRLMIGDTNGSDELLTDDDIDLFLTRQIVSTNGGTVYNVPAAAADSAGAIAAKFSRQFSFAEDGQRFDVAQRVGHYQALERDLRNRSGGYAVPIGGTATT